MTRSNESDSATERGREERDEEALRQARALLKPDDEIVRGYFVGVSYNSGNDYAFGINKASHEASTEVEDALETLATHLNVVAKATGQDVEKIATAALAVAEDQEEVGQA